MTNTLANTNTQIRNMFWTLTNNCTGYDMVEVAHELNCFIHDCKLNASIVVVDAYSITYIIWSRPVPVEVTLVRGIDD